MFYTPGGEQQLNIINESGLYSLILTSRKPEAKKFKKWVTSEVLPAIRKTGSYSVIPNRSPADELFTGNDTNNVSQIVWRIANPFHYNGAWTQAIWRSLRLATNTPSPQRFRIADLPLVVAELRRLWEVSQAADAFIDEAGTTFLKRAIRKGEDIEPLIAEQRLKLQAAIQDNAAAINGVLSRWNDQELLKVESRTPSPRYDYDTEEK